MRNPKEQCGVPGRLKVSQRLSKFCVKLRVGASRVGGRESKVWAWDSGWERSLPIVES